MEIVLIVFAVAMALTAGPFSFCKAEITFLQQPRNVTVPEGANAFFACTFRGTTGVPVWRIANNDYVTGALPPRHSYNGSGLVVSKVDLSLNLTPYSCFFTVYVEGGQLIDIESSTGFLLIAANASSISIHPSITRYTVPTVHYYITSVFIEPTITVLMTEPQLLDTLDGKTHVPVATERVIHLTPRKLDFPFVIGMAAGLGILLLIIITIITVVICVVRQKRQILKTRGNENTQDQVDIKVKRNVAYEVPPSRIKMTENRAYSTLPMTYKP